MFFEERKHVLPFVGPFKGKGSLILGHQIDLQIFVGTSICSVNEMVTFVDFLQHLQV